MSKLTNAGSIEEALLRETGEPQSEHVKPFLGHYFVSDEAMRKLEEGVDLREMNRLLTFLSAGLKKRPVPPRPKLVLDFDNDDAFQPAKNEKMVANEAVVPLELDWDEFFHSDRPKSGVKDITQAMRQRMDEATTPTVNLDVTGEAVTPNVHLEVEDKFTLKQRLLYKDLPEETYLLLSIGANLEPLIAAADKFKAEHPEISREKFIGLCANIYRGYGVRFYYQLVHNEMAFGDGMDTMVSQHIQKARGLIEKGTFDREDLEAHLAALFLVNEKMRQINDGSEPMYNRFVKTETFQEVA